MGLFWVRIVISAAKRGLHSILFMLPIISTTKVLVQSTIACYLFACLISLLCRVMACHVIVYRLRLSLKCRKRGFRLRGSRFWLTIIVLFNPSNYPIASICFTMKVTTWSERFNSRCTSEAVIIFFIVFQFSFFKVLDMCSDNYEHNRNLVN